MQPVLGSKAEAERFAQRLLVEGFRDKVLAPRAGWPEQFAYADFSAVGSATMPVSVTTRSTPPRPAGLLAAGSTPCCGAAAGKRGAVAEPVPTPLPRFARGGGRSGRRSAGSAHATPEPRASARRPARAGLALPLPPPAARARPPANRPRRAARSGQPAEPVKRRRGRWAPPARPTAGPDAEPRCRQRPTSGAAFEDAPRLRRRGGAVAIGEEATEALVERARSQAAPTACACSSPATRRPWTTVATA